MDGIFGSDQEDAQFMQQDPGLPQQDASAEFAAFEHPMVKDDTGMVSEFKMNHDIFNSSLEGAALSMSWAWQNYQLMEVNIQYLLSIIHTFKEIDPILGSLFQFSHAISTRENFGFSICELFAGIRTTDHGLPSSMLFALALDMTTMEQRMLVMAHFGHDPAKCIHPMAFYFLNVEPCIKLLSVASIRGRLLECAVIAMLKHETNLKFERIIIIISSLMPESDKHVKFAIEAAISKILSVSGQRGLDCPVVTTTPLNLLQMLNTCLRNLSMEDTIQQIYDCIEYEQKRFAHLDSTIMPLKCTFYGIEYDLMVSRSVYSLFHMQKPSDSNPLFVNYILKKCMGSEPKNGTECNWRGADLPLIDDVFFAVMKGAEILGENWEVAEDVKFLLHVIGIVYPCLFRRITDMGSQAIKTFASNRTVFGEILYQWSLGLVSTKDIFALVTLNSGFVISATHKTSESCMCDSILNKICDTIPEDHKIAKIIFYRIIECMPELGYCYLGQVIRSSLSNYE
jgi:hypothetical protein